MIFDNIFIFLKGFYLTIAGIVGFLIFAGVWIYAITSWGFLIGIMIGWIPAMIAAAIGAYLWPIVFILAYFIYKSLVH